MGVANSDVVETDVPDRLDRLPWCRFHTLVVVALGITWILDGLEVTIVASLSGALKESSLGLTSAGIGLASSAYLAGAVLGALFFGWLTDRWGRRRLFFITLGLYMAATAATAFSWSLWSFVVFRFLTGAGIGGEYSAINSTIHELIPARVRGWTDLVINGSFWIGAAWGAVLALVLLEPGRLPPELAWRLAFGVGSALCLVIVLMRLWLPESPRWLITHGRAEEAEAIVSDIERRARRNSTIPPGRPRRIKLRTRASTPLAEVAAVLWRHHRQRTLVAFTLMASQAFFYNAIFFTYALILTDFYGVPAAAIGWYILPFALGNVLGPVMLGRAFDTWGRRPMLVLTYATAGVLLIATAALFAADEVSATTLTVCWSVIFFFASAAASAAYLTVGETFPLEIRALAIALFYAIGTGIGGVAGPLLLSNLIEAGSRVGVFYGYALGGALMILAAFVAGRWSVRAERQSLEEVARPLSHL